MAPQAYHLSSDSARLLPSQPLINSRSHIQTLKSAPTLKRIDTLELPIMDREFLEKMLRPLAYTNVTKTIHRQAYPALSPSNPEFSQAGKVILIPGGGTGVGLNIAKAFVQASAATVIIIGRRGDVLAAAASQLEADAKNAGSPTKIVQRAVDIVDVAQVDKFWKDLAAENIVVDVWVANAAKGSDPKPLLTLGADEVWSQVEVNAKSALYFAERFYAQPGDERKFIINVSTASVHDTAHPGVRDRPAYTLSKATSTLVFQLLAQDVPATKVQVVSFHPGIIYSDGWIKLGVPRSDLFDEDAVPGSFAVWLATEQAEFLHGRFVWSLWDVEELATGELRKRIDSDPHFLRLSIVGLNGGALA
ncbi:hypothetical protein LTR84_001465 [Exophiala bonariae]|uniref:Uncharacterized protein n=1 Tax=Exophiala bonariae TaxID=1690606 RepID=A0AAV9NG40_9EURO|nr:hypothetical protein LTR84_001465 [Exophiala bonariae]